MKHVNEGGKRLSIIDGAYAHVSFCCQDVVDDPAHQDRFSGAWLSYQQYQRAGDQTAIVKIESGEMAGWSGTNCVGMRTTRPCRFSGRQWSERVGRFQNLTACFLVVELADKTSVIYGAEGYRFFTICFGAGNAANGSNELLTVAVKIAQ